MYSALFFCIANKVALCCSDENGKDCQFNRLFCPHLIGFDQATHGWALGISLGWDQHLQQVLPLQIWPQKAGGASFPTSLTVQVGKGMTAAPESQSHLQKYFQTANWRVKRISRMQLEVIQFLSTTQATPLGRELRKPLSLATSHVVHAAYSSANTAFIPEVMDLEKAILNH